jgi:ABC-type transport system involved in multi-copper enzyme maturation permease subunit
MNAQLRSELLKLRTTRTNLWLFAAMVGLVLQVILLHVLGLPAENFDRPSNQLEVLGRGEMLGTLFAALLGALSMTGEFSHGTIRPTFLVTPRRGRVLMAKVWASALYGSAFGLIAAAVATGAGSAGLTARGLELQLDGGDYALLLAGATAAAALWAAIGVGLGAVLRNQVPAVVGIAAWLLFVEGLFGEQVGLGDIGRFMPGALGMAASGQEPLLGPGIAVFLLALYTAFAAAGGWVATSRRDVV